MTTPSNSTWARPLCDTFVTVHNWSDRRLISGAPALVRLADGRLLCSVVLWSRDDTAARLYGRTPCHIFASDDEGASWRELARLPFVTGKLLCRGDNVWFMGAGTGWDGFWVASSRDGGATWAEPSLILPGQVFAASTGWVKDSNTLYWAMDDRNLSGADREVFAVSADLTSDLSDPAAWRHSNGVAQPGLPDILSRGRHTRTKWLEPNVVQHEGRLSLVVRVVARDAEHGLTPNMAGICDLHDDGDPLHLEFSHYYPIPGAQNHFHIVLDPVTDLHWMTSNQVTGVPGECWQGCGDERRFLMLHYSVDALNWFPAGCAAMGASHRHAFNYCTPLIDGDDLLIASRTSIEGANHHDNDRVTFHRVRAFRSLALSLRPDPEGI